MNVDRDRVVAARNLRKRVVDVALAAVELGEQLFDGSAFLEHRNEALAQRLLLRPQRIDTRLQVADLVAGLLDLRRPLGFRKPLRHRADGVLRIGARQMMNRRVGIDLRLDQRLDALANAAKPHLERIRRLALPDHRIAEPQRRWDERDGNKDDQEPSQLLRQRLAAKRFE